MWIVLFFLLPLVASAVLKRRRPDLAARPWSAAAAALAVAATSAAGVFVLVAQSDRWRDRTEIAWIGVDSSQAPRRIAIGGSPGGDTLGWPGGFGWPRLELQDAAGGIAARVAGGGGLIEINGTPVNGIPLIADQDQLVRGFRVRLKDRWWPLADRIEVRAATAFEPELPREGYKRWWRRRWHGEDPPLATFSIRPTASGVSMTTAQVAPYVLALRRAAAARDLELALALEEWARMIRVAAAGGGVRLLDEAQPGHTADATVAALPASIVVRWPRRVLRAEIWDTGSRLHLGFKAPWRTASPLPPERPAGAKPVVLKITNRPAPGDYVFDLPFGRAVPDVREQVEIVQHPERGEVFAGSPEPDRRLLLPPGVAGREMQEARRIEQMRSTTCEAAGPARPCLAIVQDVVGSAAMVEMLSVALAAFAVTLLLAARLLQALPNLAWTLSLVMACAWNLLAFRLLLSLRYTLDPTGLDRLAAEGVALAAGGLVIVPAMLSLSALVYRERFEMRTHVSARNRTVVLLTVLAALCGAGLWQAARATNVWPNLPDDFDPGIPEGVWILAGGAFAAGLFAILQQVLFSPRQQQEHAAFSVLNWPLGWFERACAVWQQSQSLRAGRWYWAAPMAGLLLVIVALFLLSVPTGQSKVASELGYPLLIGVSCLVFWLGIFRAFAAPREPGTSRPPATEWRGLILPVIGFVCLPAAGPILLGDPGGMYSMLGLFLATGVVLVLSRLPRFGAAVILGCVAIVAGLVLTVKVVADVPVAQRMLVGYFDRGAARVTSYVYGNDVQRMLPFASAQADTGDGLPADALRGAIEHPWESGAIIYRGAWLGLGFAEAPNRRSSVPQEVLQYDSTFSFFVAGDHGVVGGAALLALYLVPLLLVARSSREYFDTGHALALVAAAWLVAEAVVHVSVNLEGLPFTGRNLPWLSVNSTADLLRWAVVFGLVVQGMLWRATGSHFLYSDDVDVVAGAMPDGSAVLDMPGTRKPSIWQSLREPAFRASFLVPAAAIAAVAALAVYPAARALSRHSWYGEPFSWTPFFNEVQQLLDDGRLRWNADTWTIDPSPLKDMGLPLDGTTLLEQEIARFNAMPRDHKRGMPVSIAERLERARSSEAYEAILQHLAMEDRTGITPRPALFQVESRIVALDDGTEEMREYPRVDTAGNTLVSFDAEHRRDQLPVVTFRPVGEAPGAWDHIVGAAWFSGRWRSVTITDGRIPWAGALGAAVRADFARHDQRGDARFQTLTLDSALQTRAMQFAAAKGSARHGELLARGLHASNAIKALPPRVALAVLALPSGETLALGGWPAMNAGESWRRTPSGVQPPASWLATRAPRALAYRYIGDRNFDTIEMGSATKPLWAAAALKIHPRLNERLRTRGDDVLETEVFGIPITEKGWAVRPSGWVDFRNYLSESDNRYHVRLGFLALAESANGVPVAGTAPGSTKESLSVRDGQPVPWGRAPRFLPSIRFSAATPKEFEAVNRTPLAEHLRAMFGAGVERGDYHANRRSFWTRDERDDREGREAADLPLAFLEISPAAVNLQLDRLQDPRGFVSLLLGGGNNRWSNVDFAAAFATAVTGKPVLPRAVEGDVVLWDGRTEFVEAAAKLRPGLAGTVSDGTAAAALAGSLGWIREAGLTAYAKTGTLSMDRGATQTSRLVVALVDWRNPARGEVDRGIVLSLVAERAEPGYAAAWLGEFLSANRDILLRLIRR